MSKISLLFVFLGVVEVNMMLNGIINFYIFPLQQLTFLSKKSPFLWSVILAKKQFLNTKVPSSAKAFKII